MSKTQTIHMSCSRSPSVFKHAVQLQDVSSRCLDSDDAELHFVAPAFPSGDCTQCRRSTMTTREVDGSGGSHQHHCTDDLAECFCVAKQASLRLEQQKCSQGCAILESGVTNAVRELLVEDTMEFAFSKRRYPFIETGYRPTPLGTKSCLISLFGWHNETMNVWTHLFGAAVLMYLLTALLFDLKSPFPSGMDEDDKFIFGLYLVAGITCMIISSTYHLFSAGYEEYFERLVVADHLGILVLMMGSNIPMIYYGFYETSILQLLYFVGSLISIVVAAYVLHQKADRSQLFKLVVFSGVCSFAMCQLVHDFWNRGGIRSINSEAALAVWVQSFRWYVMGAVFYILKIPERFSPGTFDHLLSSHQIWHVFVILGALQHVNGSILYMQLAKPPL